MAAARNVASCPTRGEPHFCAHKEATPIDREAWHKAAIRQAGRHAQAHPEMVDDYSDADMGL